MWFFIAMNVVRFQEFQKLFRRAGWCWRVRFMVRLWGIRGCPRQGFTEPVGQWRYSRQFRAKIGETSGMIEKSTILFYSLHPIPSCSGQSAAHYSYFCRPSTSGRYNHLSSCFPLSLWLRLHYGRLVQSWMAWFRAVCSVAVHLRFVAQFDALRRSLCLNLFLVFTGRDAFVEPDQEFRASCFCLKHSSEGFEFA